MNSHGHSKLWKDFEHFPRFQKLQNSNKLLKKHLNSGKKPSIAEINFDKQQCWFILENFRTFYRKFRMKVDKFFERLSIVFRKFQIFLDWLNEMLLGWI